MAERNGLAQTLVELADTLVADFDVVDFLHTLALRCTELLDAAEAGLMLADQRGGLRVVASSSERARLLELFEVQNEQGPCLDCFRSGGRVVAVIRQGYAQAARRQLQGPRGDRGGSAGHVLRRGVGTRSRRGDPPVPELAANPTHLYL